MRRDRQTPVAVECGLWLTAVRGNGEAQKILFQSSLVPGFVFYLANSGTSRRVCKQRASENLEAAKAKLAVVHQGSLL